MKALLALLLMFPLALGAAQPRLVLGGSAYDQVLTSFYNQQGNADRTVLALTTYATQPFGNALLPATIEGRGLSGIFTLSGVTWRTYDSGAAAYREYDFAGVNGAPLSSNTVSRVGASETLWNKTLYEARHGDAGGYKTGLLYAQGASAPRFIAPLADTNTFYILRTPSAPTPATYLQFIDGVLAAGSVNALASPDFVTNYTDTINNSKAFAGGVWMLGTSTSSHYVNHTLGAAIGTNDLTLWFRVRVPLANPLLPSGLGGINGARSFGFWLTQSGQLVLRLQGETTSDSRKLTYETFIADYAGQIVDIFATRAAGQAAIHINGQAVTTAETTTGTPPAWSGEVGSTSWFVGLHTSVYGWPERIYQGVLFNRALSAADQRRVREGGIDYADQWGTVTPIINHNPALLNGGFETAGGGGADVFGTWTEYTAGTSTLVRDTSTYHSGAAAARMTVDGADSDVWLDQASSVTAGKWYRLKFWARRDATAGGLTSRGATAATAWTNTLTTTWTQYAVDFVASSTSFGLRRAVGSPGATIYLDDVELQPIGALLAPDLEIGVGRFIPDRSVGRRWGEAIGTVVHLQPKTAGEVIVHRTFSHSEISASAATTELLDLPPYAGILDVELDRTAMDASTTLSIGISGNDTKFVNGANLAASGLLWVDSSSKGSESTSAETSIYLKKNQATTTGSVAVRLRYTLRGP